MFENYLCIRVKHFIKPYLKFSRMYFRFLIEFFSMPFFKEISWNRQSIKFKMWIYLGFGPNMRSLKTFVQISQADLIKFWIWFVSIRILQQIVTRNDIQLGSRCKMQIKVLGTRSKSPQVLRRIKLIYSQDEMTKTLLNSYFPIKLIALNRYINLNLSKSNKKRKNSKCWVFL